MKNKNIFLYITIIIYSLFLDTSFAEDTLNHEIRLGFGKASLNVSGYEDAVLNDDYYYQYHVAGTFIEFSKSNQTTSVIQINLGYSYKITPEHIIDLDFLSGSSGDISANVFALGYAYNLDLNDYMEGLYFQPSVAFGSVSVKAKFGTVGDNGNMPISISDGGFYEGDEIESKADGSATKLGLKLVYKRTNEILVYLSLENWLTSFDKPKTTIKGIEIKDKTAFDTGYYDGGTIYYDPSSNIDPFESSEMKYEPAMLMIGVGYNF